MSDKAMSHALGEQPSASAGSSSPAKPGAPVASASANADASKVLLMGRAGAGKTSMRSIIFANYMAKETMRLQPTNQIEYSNMKFLGNLQLNLWDCGGQDVFMENYFESQKEHIFRGVGILIYVISIVPAAASLVTARSSLASSAKPAPGAAASQSSPADGESGEDSKEIAYFRNTVESLRQFSPNAKVFCLVHKCDLVPPAERQSTYQKVCDALALSAHPTNITFFATSIWDETLYRAWSSILHTCVKGVDVIESELSHVATVLEADELVLFEKATYLVIANKTGKPAGSPSGASADPLRFEKISNIVKQFKLGASKHLGQMTSLRIESESMFALMEEFSPNTVLLVVYLATTQTDQLHIMQGALALNLQLAKQRFSELAAGACKCL